MRAEIIEKLDTFLQKHVPIKEECEVVYIMIELRKLLDREKEIGSKNSNSLIRFYADWIVHTKKSHITTTIRIIMDKIEKLINPYPEKGDLSFLLLPQFRSELATVFQEYKLSRDLVINNSYWRNFVYFLAQILADQPLVNPSSSIAEFRYIKINNNKIMVNIDFKGHKKGQSITLGGDINTL